MWRSLLQKLMALVIIASLMGCGTSPEEKTARSTTITATGRASIENWSSLGLKTTRLLIIHIDDVLLQSKGAKGVYPLTSGPHIVHVNCQFSRPTLTDLIIDAGDAQLRFEAKAGVRYRIQGQKLNNASAELWVAEVATGQAVTERLNVPLNATPQHVVVPIPIQI